MEGDKTKVTIHDFTRMCKTIDNCLICPLIGVQHNLKKSMFK